MNLPKLRGKIKEKYRYEKDLADDLYLSKGELNLILNGKRKLSLELAGKLIEKLDLTEDEAMSIFFRD